MGTLTASEAAAEDVAFKFREEIDDLVAESAAQDALARLQDFVRDFAPDLKKDVLLLRARHSAWRTNQRSGIDTGEKITAIRAAILDLADQTFEEAGGRGSIGLRLVVDNAPPPVAPTPTPVSAPTLEETETAPNSQPAAAAVVSITPLLSSVDVERTAGQGGLDNLRRHYFKTLRRGDDLLACSSRNITRKYARGGFSLNPLSLDLRAGEITGIVGRNASGKTTLLKLLMGEIKPDAGEGIPVIPLLIDKARMPMSDELPASIAQLHFNNGVPIRPNPDFDGDVERLMTRLRAYVSYQPRLSRRVQRRLLAAAEADTTPLAHLLTAKGEAALRGT